MRIFVCVWVFSSPAASFPPWPAAASHTKWPASLAANTRYLVQPVCVLHVHVLCMLFWNLASVSFNASVHCGFPHFVLKKKNLHMVVVSCRDLRMAVGLVYLLTRWEGAVCVLLPARVVPPRGRSSSCCIMTFPMSPVNVCSVQLACVVLWVSAENLVARFTILCVFVIFFF